MHLDPLVNEVSETPGTLGSSFYTEPHSEDTLSAELLRVAKLSHTISAQFVTSTTSSDTISAQFVTSTTSTSVISGVVKDLMKGQQEVVHLLEKWRTNAWMPACGHLTRLFTHRNSETFTQQESSVTELIANVRTSSDMPFGKRLAARLESLTETSKEEFPEQEPISHRSLHDFLIFIRSVLDIAYPDVVLTYKGHIRAEWTKSRNRHFAVEFLGANEVRFVVFAPDPKKPYKTNRASGLSALDSLMELVRPYGVLVWIADPNEKAA